MTYVGYLDVHGAIKATQYNHLTKEVNEVLVRSNFQPDDHNNPTFLALPDGRIMIFYSRHTDEACFYYRISKEAGDITTFGEEKKLVTNHNTTYPSPFIMAKDPDHIYLTWRGINWHPTIARLTMPDKNDNIRFDGDPRQIVSSSVGANTRPYAKYTSDGVSRIYLTYTATHPDNISPNPLYCSYVDITDMTLHDMKGNKLSDINNGAFRIDGTETDPNFVVDDRSAGTRDWVWEIALQNGSPVIAMVRISPDKTSHDYYYARWNGSAWTKTLLGNAGGKFHLSDIEHCYSGGMALDKDQPGIVYASMPVEGIYGKVYEIIKFEMNENGTEIIKRSQVTRNSEKNNVRPFMVQGAGDGPKLMWMNGDYFYWIVNSSYPKGYATSIMTDYKLPDYKSDAAERLLFEKAEKVNLKGVADTVRIEENLFKNMVADGFTVMFRANIAEENYTSGHNFSLLNMADGTFSLSVRDVASTDSVVSRDPLTGGATVVTPGRLPVLTTQNQAGKAEYRSTNMLSDSDWNITRGLGTTNGSKNVNNMGWTDFAVSYDAKTGKTVVYIDGLLDMNVTSKADMISELAGEAIVFGGFTGEISDIRIYGKSLAQDEILKVMNHASMDGADRPVIKSKPNTPEPSTTKPNTPKPDTAGNGDKGHSVETKKAVQGKIYTVKKIRYKVTSTKKKTVSIVSVSNKKMKSCNIGGTVKIKGTRFRITRIENSAFAKCKKLKKVAVGAKVTSIGKRVFYKCSHLKKIVIQSKKLKKVGGSAFKGIHKKAIIKVPKKKWKAYKKLLKKKGQAETVKIKK